MNVQTRQAHQRLSREIREQVDAAAARSRQIWDPSSRRSSTIIASSPAPSPLIHGLQRPGPQVNTIPRLESSISDTSTMLGAPTRSIVSRTDSSATAVGAMTPNPISMDQDLMSRGKGPHTCPQGYRCQKGGVDREGRLVVFQWNSSFRYLRPLPCPIPLISLPNPSFLHSSYLNPSIYQHLLYL